MPGFEGLGTLLAIIGAIMRLAAMVLVFAVFIKEYVTAVIC